MRHKVITFYALMFVMGAYLFPITVSAASGGDTTPPTVTAAINGDLLNISAKDDSSGVDAVLINGRRVNYRVDGAVDLPLAEYAGTGESINIYAVDFAGNMSDTVTIQNPLCVPSGLSPEPTPEANGGAAADSGPRPFTPAGTGSVVDNPTDSDGKEFFTIKTPDGNDFFLIIDRQRNEDGVYLLNAVTEQDLMGLAKSSGSSSVSAIPADLTPAPTLDTSPEPTLEPPPPLTDNSGGGSLIFIIIAVIAAGAAGYYFKIVRPKQQSADDDGEDYEDEADTGDNDVYDDSDDDESKPLDEEGELIGLDFEPADTYGKKE